MPHASLLPLSTAVADVLPFPAEFNTTVTFWQTATGFVTSCVVIVAVQVLELELASVTVRVSVWLPTSEHPKLV